MNPILTRVAHADHGDNAYFGRRALGDLLGRETYAGLMAFAVTGKAPTEPERRLLDDLAVVMTSADPRIWPLKLTRLVASYGGTLAGYAAGQLAMEGKQIGPWIIGHAASLLVELRQDVRDIEDPVDVDRAVRAFAARHARLVGYGVPLRKCDERMEALRKHLASLGRDTLPYWHLQEALSAHLLRERRVSPNVGMGDAAMLLDMGYSPKQASAATTFLNQNVFAANALEASEQRAPDMQKLPAACIEYVGRAPRSLSSVEAVRPA